MKNIPLIINDGSKASMKKSPLIIIFQSSKYALLITLLAILLFPMYWMVISSFTQNRYLLNLPPHFIPVMANIENYIKIFHNMQYLNYFKNSFINAGGTVLLTLGISVFAGYGFSRYRFRGKNMLLTGILTVQMFPIVAILISLYTFYFRWGLLNTYAGLILADTTFCLPLSITLMKAFFDTLPLSLDESAKIDGAGRLRILCSILTPLTLPGIVAVGIYTFLSAWDDFLMSLIIMQAEAMKTLTVGITQSFMGEYAHDYASMMAFAVAGSAPIVILFVFFQKYMISGLTTGAVKG
jgi:multiple sugar transport system permease protein